MYLFILFMSIIFAFLYGFRIWLLMTRQSHPNADLLISELEQLCGENGSSAGDSDGNQKPEENRYLFSMAPDSGCH